MKQRRTYIEAVQSFLRLAELAREAYIKFPREGNEIILRSSEMRIQQRMDADQKYRNLVSLKYDEVEVLTFFNEGSGPTVEYFWKRIAEEGLPYQRKDVLGDVLKRGRIRTRQEYDVIVDTYIPAQQEGRITSEQAIALGSMIEDYENRAAKKKK